MNEGQKTTRVELLRWLCVLPAAVLADLLVDFLTGWSLSGATAGITAALVLHYLPPKAAFVIAGAKMSPGHRVRTAVVLALLGFLSSATKHVVGQHLAGNRVGLTNFLHLSAETVGLLVGMAFITWQRQRVAPPIH